MQTTIRPLGLYLHIPFCRQKCAYCDFYSLPTGDDKSMDAYVQALTAHLTETAPSALRHTVDSVYIGGGTPSLLGEKRLKQLLKVVQKQYHLAKDAEITLEANPESACDLAMMKGLRKAGVNRLSLGVQSADDALLQKIGRIHSFAQVEEAVRIARKAGISNLSMDLMYGLPEQSMEDWMATLQKVVALQPEHLSCYGLKLEQGTPLYLCREELTLADDDEQADMYLSAVDYLKSQGYEQYEVSNFAKTGYASRHNQKYWRQEEYAGFGPGAHSDFGEVRYAYAKDLPAYLRGELSLSESESLPLRERWPEYLMLRLRTIEGLEQTFFERTFRQRFSALLPVLEKCEQAGYAVCEAGHWHLTPEGFLRSNAIIVALQNAMAEEITRRSQHPAWQK